MESARRWTHAGNAAIVPAPPPEPVRALEAEHAVELGPPRSTSVKRVSGSTAKAILYGGLTAGTIDIGSACVINLLSPIVICHAIASGLLGSQSFRGGAASAVLGLFLQWGMALIIAAVYVAAARLLPWLGRRWVAGGLLYGIVVFAVMNYLVVPLSAAAPPHYFTVQHLLHRFPADKFVENLLAMFLFGLIVAFFAQRFAPACATDGAGADDAPAPAGQPPASA